MSLFKIRDLVKVYGTRKVLDIERLDIEKGKIYALFGPNGSGKTTLLEIISLLIRPSRGSIYYEGTRINYSSRDLTRLRREIIMVHQHPVLFTTSVYNNLDFGLKVRGVDKTMRRKIIEECLDLVGMKDFMFAHAPSLSGGEKQRVAIARALACSPKVLFLDEPTASVDAQNQVVIEGIVSDINLQRNISIIITTHDLTQARRMANEMIPIYEGRIASSVHENIFAATLDGHDDSLVRCTIKGGPELQIETERRGQVRISIDPLAVRILDRKPPNGENNVIEARVRQLTDEYDKIRIYVDIGVPLNLVMSKEAMMAQRVFVGDAVWIHIPQTAIRLF